MKSGSDLAYELYRRQHNATVRIMEDDGFLSLIPLVVKREFAMVAAQHISQKLATCCPEDDQPCDMGVCVVNLFEALALLLQLDENALFMLLRDVPKYAPTLSIIDVSAFIGGPMARFKKKHALNDYTFFAGPQLFKLYRETMKGRDSMLEVYEAAIQEQHLMGWPKGEGVRRIHYVAVILTNRGQAESDMQRYCEAVSRPPDYNQMDQVKAVTNRYAPDLAKYILMLDTEEERQQAWIEQQQRFLVEEEKTRAIAKDSTSNLDAAEKLLKDAKESLDICLVCSEKSTSSCGKCKKARYCSKECQRKDWPRHKKIECI